jgi:protease IV
MKQFLLTMAGVFAGLMLFLIGVPILLVALAASAARPDPLPAHAILELDLREPLNDQEPVNPLAGLGRQRLSVMSIIATLREAEGDDRVQGLLIRLPEGGVDPAAADEIRQAVRRLRAAGKRVIAHSQGLYPSGIVTSTYMIGAAADEFWMQPGSSFQATGLATEDVFLKRFFDRYGVTPDFQQRREYKNAVNPYLHEDYTPAHREAQVSWMSSVYRTALVTAAADRRRQPEALIRSLEAGPYLAEDAVRAGLIDRVGQVREAQRALAGERKDAELVNFEDYDRRDVATDGAGPTIAVIEGEGAIVTGEDSAANPFSGGSAIYSDDISEAFYEAAEDEAVKAIVFRISSPGGSDTASEQILAALRTAKAAGKPVVISMGTYAASGGYWVASQASAIVAQPTTLTGSIGVYGGKFAVGPALARFGLDVRETGVGGAYADAFSLGQPFSDQDRAAFSAWMDRIYANFVARVAEGRKLPAARVQEIARGRVWTGAQAHQLGLVDELGGFYQAVDRAKALAGLKGEVRLKRMNRQVSPFEALEQALGVSAASARTLAAAARLMGDPRAEALLDELARARMGAAATTVMAPTPIR